MTDSTPRYDYAKVLPDGTEEVLHENKALDPSYWSIGDEARMMAYRLNAPVRVRIVGRPNIEPWTFLPDPDGPYME